MNDIKNSFVAHKVPHFYGLVEAGAWRELQDFMVQGKINRQTQ